MQSRKEKRKGGRKGDMNNEGKMGRKMTGEGRNVKRKAINKIIEL